MWSQILFMMETIKILPSILALSVSKAFHIHDHIWSPSQPSGVARGNIIAAGNEDNIQMERFNQCAGAVFYFCDADVEMENKQKGRWNAKK